jgi:hypothetical protein
MQPLCREEELSFLRHRTVRICSIVNLLLKIFFFFKPLPACSLAA